MKIFIVFIVVLIIISVVLFGAVYEDTKQLEKYNKLLEEKGCKGLLNEISPIMIIIDIQNSTQIIRNVTNP